MFPHGQVLLAVLCCSSDPVLDLSWIIREVNQMTQRFKWIMIIWPVKVRKAFVIPSNVVTNISKPYSSFWPNGLFLLKISTLRLGMIGPISTWNSTRIYPDFGHQRGSKGVVRCAFFPIHAFQCSKDFLQRSASCRCLGCAALSFVFAIFASVMGFLVLSGLRWPKSLG